MRYISHRGNLEGPNPETENEPSQIEKVLSLGHDVEIDVWFVGEQFYLGHDTPQYLISDKFLTKEGLWCHAKNWQALEEMLKMGVHCFWHQEDRYTLTSRAVAWVYPGNWLPENSICVMPELTSFTDSEMMRCMGVCTDYVQEYISKFENYGKTGIHQHHESTGESDGSHHD